MVFCLGERLHYHQSLISWLGLLYSQSAIATTSSSPDSRASRMRFLSCSSFSESMAIKLLRQDLARVYSDLRGFLQTKQQHRTNKTTQEVKVRSFQHRRVRFTLLWFTFVGHVLIQNISLYFLFKKLKNLIKIIVCPFKKPCKSYRSDCFCWKKYFKKMKALICWKFKVAFSF